MWWHHCLFKPGLGTTFRRDTEDRSLWSGLGPHRQHKPSPWLSSCHAEMPTPLPPSRLSSSEFPWHVSSFLSCQPGSRLLILQDLLPSPPLEKLPWSSELGFCDVPSAGWSLSLRAYILLQSVSFLAPEPWLTQQVKEHIVSAQQIFTELLIMPENFLENPKVSVIPPRISNATQRTRTQKTLAKSIMISLTQRKERGELERHGFREHWQY